MQWPFTFLRALRIPGDGAERKQITVVSPCCGLLNDHRALKALGITPVLRGAWDMNRGLAGQLAGEGRAGGDDE
eukprot:3896120-Pyramimonas_sp.AAC.1